MTQQPTMMIAVDAGELIALRQEIAELRRSLQAVQVSPRPDFVTVEAYAESVGKTTKTVRNWVRDGKVESRREGSKLMIRRIA